MSKGNALENSCLDMGEAVTDGSVSAFLETEWRSRTSTIVVAGVLALVVCMGIARFSFTSLLPWMQADGLTLDQAGALAAVNYAGYLSGALLATLLGNSIMQLRLFQLGMGLSVLTTAAMGMTEGQTIWMLLRFLSGFGSALGMVVGSAVMMYALAQRGRTALMSVYFGGIGAGIVLSGTCIALLLPHMDWKAGWVFLGILGFALAVWPLYALQASGDDQGPRAPDSSNTSTSIWTPAVGLLIVAYFCEGIGYVVSGTFLPSIIQSIDGLEKMGELAWIVVGLAAAPSCLLWVKAAHRFGEVKAMMVAYSVQAFGIILPAVSSSPFANLLGAFLYGGTFLGIVALVLSLGGRLAGRNPARLIGALTVAFGLGQIVGPLYAAALTESTGNYDAALILTGAIILLGVVTLWRLHIYRLLPQSTPSTSLQYRKNDS